MLELLQTETPIDVIATRLLVAVAAGMVIGFDREARSKPAGLRTHMLISLASATFTLITFELTITAIQIDSSIRPDPVRLTEAVVAGVAFLGAGTIIQARGRVEGITTGASIWLAGAVGVACGGGYYPIAAIALVLAIVVLTLVGLIEHRVKSSAENGSLED